VVRARTVTAMVFPFSTAPGCAGDQAKRQGRVFLTR
jgi:hypothetical protein